jgi:hypothetical protein
MFIFIFIYYLFPAWDDFTIWDIGGPTGRSIIYLDLSSEIYTLKKNRRFIGGTGEEGRGQWVEMSEHDSTHITIMHANFIQLLYAHGHPHLTGVGATALDDVGVQGGQQGAQDIFSGAHGGRRATCISFW